MTTTESKYKIDAAYQRLREAARECDNPTLSQVTLDVAGIVFELGSYADRPYGVDPLTVQVDCYCRQCIIYRLVQAYPDRH